MGMHGLGLLAAVAAIAMASPAQGTSPAPEPRVSSLTFGVYSFKKPTEVYRDFSVVIDEIGRRLSARAPLPVTVHLRVFKTYDACLESFVAGEVDFVRFGPSSYVLAKQRRPEIQLLAVEREDGEKPGLIVVRDDSPVQTLADLKGRSFAFGDENSTIGRYLAQAELVKAGVRAADLGRQAYLERHDKVFKAVEIGDFDAGALHIATFRELHKDVKLRVIASFENLGKPWIARAGLGAASVKALQQVLVGLDTKEVLAALKIAGFQAVVDKDLDFVRDGMRRAQEFATVQAAPGK